MKKTLSLVLACLLLILAVGCSSSSRKDSTVTYSEPQSAYAVAEEAAYYGDSDAYMENKVAYESSVSSAAGSSSESIPESASNNKKIIYNANVSIRTDDPVAALSQAIALCESYGGYIESSFSRPETNGRSASANATLKVPAEKLDALLEGVKGLGKVETSNIYSNDITGSYYDIQARLNAQKAEEQTLLKLLDECTNVEEVLAVREQLLEVREQIESYQARINSWDNQVSYATIELSISQTIKPVVEKEEEPIELWKSSEVWKKIKLGFSNSWRFVVNAVYAIGIGIAYGLLPVIVIGGIIFLLIKLIVSLVRKGNERKQKKKELKAKKSEETSPEIKEGPATKEEPSAKHNPSKDGASKKDKDLQGE